ncbi:MAG: hypothetical protein C4576_27035 [Desulfobacteraceae bacterium]|nr:MAG: hypothetical protein C4576_27035 [Desulfobacteraceae bacterium]
MSTFYTGAVAPLEGVKVYLFNEAGSYLNQHAVTGDQGEVAFNLPEKSYKVRVDYLGSQYWSELFQWQDEEVVIDEGVVDLHVTWNGAEVSNAPVYLFTETGSYLNRLVNTDPYGHAQFTVPVKGYKFRIDYNGQQYWTSVITPIAHQSLEIEVPLEQLALMPTNNPHPDRYDGEAPVYAGEPVKVATLGTLMGLLTQTTIARVPQPKVYYFHTDHLGTPQKLTDATGAVVWSGDYKPFGEVATSVSTISSHFRFPGQYLDDDTSLHYNYHRYYEPSTGRYLKADPLGLLSGTNLYVYVSGNPPNLRDVFGLDSRGDYTYKSLIESRPTGLYRIRLHREAVPRPIAERVIIEVINHFTPIISFDKYKTDVYLDEQTLKWNVHYKVHRDSWIWKEMAKVPIKHSEEWVCEFEPKFTHISSWDVEVFQYHETIVKESDIEFVLEKIRKDPAVFVIRNMEKK